jgi:hypothetical protein
MGHGNLAVPGATPSLIWGQLRWPRAGIIYELVKGAVGIYSRTPCELGFIILNGFYSKQYKETYFFLLFGKSGVNHIWQ